MVSLSAACDLIAKCARVRRRGIQREKQIVVQQVYRSRSGLQYKTITRKGVSSRLSCCAR